MSNIVEHIFDQITSVTQDALGADYVPLRRVFDVEQNDSRTMEKAFGVRHGEAISADGVNRVYTMDHSFEIILVNRAVGRDGDSAIQETFNGLYDKADEVLKKIFLSKLNLPNIVLIVDSPSIDTPELLSNGAAMLVVGFNVKYRQAINN